MDKQGKLSGKTAAALLLTVLLLVTALTGCREERTETKPTQAPETEASTAPTEKKLTPDEKMHIISESGEYPEAMVTFAENYPQTIDYVYEYPLKKDGHPEIDLTKEASGDRVPLLIQWDDRWGYAPYGSGLIGHTGCGPVCLSMVALYLTGDAQWTPIKVADFAMENGYYVPGSGTSWALLSEGSKMLGLTAKTLPLSEKAMADALKDGKPIILSVGIGDFSKVGHFIVVTDYRDGSFTVNDPNSRENSAKSWTFSQLRGQIMNLWAFSTA